MARTKHTERKAPKPIDPTSADEALGSRAPTPAELATFGLFHCSYCDACYKHAQSLRRHMAEKHHSTVKGRMLSDVAAAKYRSDKGAKGAKLPTTSKRQHSSTSKKAPSAKLPRKSESASCSSASEMSGNASPAFSSEIELSSSELDDNPPPPPRSGAPATVTHLSDVEDSRGPTPLQDEAASVVVITSRGASPPRAAGGVQCCTVQTRSTRELRSESRSRSTSPTKSAAGPSHELPVAAAVESRKAPSKKSNHGTRKESPAEPSVELRKGTTEVATTKLPPESPKRKAVEPHKKAPESSKSIKAPSKELIAALLKEVLKAQAPPNAPSGEAPTDQLAASSKKSVFSEKEPRTGSGNIAPSSTSTSGTQQQKPERRDAGSSSVLRQPSATNRSKEPTPAPVQLKAPSTERADMLLLAPLKKVAVETQKAPTIGIIDAGVAGPSKSNEQSPPASKQPTRAGAEVQPSAARDPFIRQPTRPPPIHTPAVRPTIELSASSRSRPRHTAASILSRAVLSSPEESIESIATRLTVECSWTPEERLLNIARMDDMRDATDMLAIDTRALASDSRSNPAIDNLYEFLDYMATSAMCRRAWHHR